MTPARTFVRLWVLFSLLTLAYAACDFALNPWLEHEVGFSMQPDFSRIPELLHWGGRLYYNGAWYLLVCNALALGGIGSLIAAGGVAAYRRWWAATDSGQAAEG